MRQINITEHCWFSYSGQTAQLGCTGENTIVVGHASMIHVKAHKYNSPATNRT